MTSVIIRDQAAKMGIVSTSLQDMRLTQQIALPGNIKALPNGSRVVGIGPAEAREDHEAPVPICPFDLFCAVLRFAFCSVVAHVEAFEPESFAHLEKLKLPASIFLRVELIRHEPSALLESSSTCLGNHL